MSNFIRVSFNSLLKHLGLSFGIHIHLIKPSIINNFTLCFYYLGVLPKFNFLKDKYFAHNEIFPDKIIPGSNKLIHFMEFILSGRHYVKVDQFC